jgi:hypothetical protein
MHRDGSNDHPSPKEARDLLANAYQQAETLNQTIGALGPLTSLVRQAAAEDCEDFDKLRISLVIASAAFRHAARSIPKGRPVSARTHLVRLLAARLEDAKLPVEHTSSGGLSILTAILLEAAEEDPESAPQLLRGAFGKRKADKSAKS